MGSFLFFLALAWTAVASAKYPDAAAIEKNAVHWKSVEDFLGWISRDYPPLLSDFTLMRASRSTQAATPAAPRAIVFSDDGKFVFTFNAAGADVEMFHFTGSRFEFRELSFSGTRAKLSEVNPGKCVRCHYSPPRPIWDEYPEWTGAYGAFDDAIYAPGVSTIGITRENTDGERAQEYRDFLAFQAARPRHPRYAFLRPRAGTMAPFSAHPRVEGMELRPNLRLTKLFSTLQGEALAARAARDAECFEHVAPAAIAATWECGRDDTFWQAAEAVKASASRLHFLVDRNLGTEVALARALGLEAADYALTREPSWRYFQGVTMIEADFGDGLYEFWRRSRPELPPFSYADARREELYRETKYAERQRPLCEAVLARSRELAPKLEAFARSGGCRDTYDDTVVPATVRLCASCHDGSDPTAPKLALDDKTKVNAALVQRVRERLDSTISSRRMPPDRALLDRERAELERWLNSAVRDSR